MRDIALAAQERAAILQRFTDAIRSDDQAGFEQAFDSLAQNVEERVLAQARGQLDEMDREVLATRGVRQLTGEENKYYQKVIAAMRAANPKQALSDIDVVMPKTVIDSVFEDLKSEHPLLSKINFIPTNGITEFLTSVSGIQKATWGKLCTAITKELEAGFRSVKTDLLKLSAWIPVCSAMLDLGPSYLDRYVRELLYEALANGLEEGIVSGDGNEKPIGMTRQVQENVVRTGNAYPEKTAVKVHDLGVKTMGNLISLLAVVDSGKPRVVSDLVFLVNPQDYFQLILPATSFLKADGSYARNVLPVDAQIIQTLALPRGKAVFGMARQYFANVGMERGGRIEYSDEVHFLEDERLYKMKLYANGFPKDNNSFLVLDISELGESTFKVESVVPRTPSADATLSSLVLEGLTLSPEFDAATLNYTASATDASATIRAVPADAAAKVELTVNSNKLDNGARVSWQDGSNAVKVTVTAEDDKTKKTYSITVTKTGV